MLSATQNSKAVQELQDSCSSYITQFDAFISSRRLQMESDLFSFCSQQQDFKNAKLKLMEDLEKGKAVVEELDEKHRDLNKKYEEHKDVVTKLREDRNAEEDKRVDLVAKNNEIKRKIEEKRNGLQPKIISRVGEKVERSRRQQEFTRACARILSKDVGFEDEHVRLTYTCIDEKDSAKEFSFDLSVRVDNYSVLKCVPKLNPDRLEILVQDLNESRDFGEFLKQMRAQFVIGCKVLG